jgi:hypothetical protein
MSHISTLQVVFDAIFLVIMSVTMFMKLTVWRLWLAVFSLLPVSVPSHPHHVSLQAHYIYIMCMHVTSTAVHFICFWLQPCGIYGMHSHIRTLYYSYTHHICAVACEFLLLSFTTSGGMFLAAFSTLKALLPSVVILVKY